MGSGRQSPEHKIQVAICELLNYGLPKSAIFWAVPNGGSRSQIKTKNGKSFSLEGKRMKDEGVKPGVSDLMILWDGRLICLEVKAEKGRQSTAQKEWEQELTAAGGLYRVVRSTDEVRTFLSMVIPTFKARLGQGCNAKLMQHPNKGLTRDENDIDDWLQGKPSNEAKAGFRVNKVA